MERLADWKAESLIRAGLAAKGALLSIALRLMVDIKAARKYIYGKVL